MPRDALSVRVRLEAREGFHLEAAFEAPPGVTILFGPSGSGKSTLLSCIAGLLRPDEGRIALGGDVFFDRATKTDVAIEQRKVALVFQSGALFPHMTALENVAFGISRALPRREREERARRALARFRVEKLEARKPRTFSGGEAQRVALARALAMEPRLVLLDEPFSALDRDLRQELVLELRGIADELEVPIVHVTHQRGEARALGDRVVCLRDGRIEAVGSLALLDEDEHARGLSNGRPPLDSNIERFEPSRALHGEAVRTLTSGVQRRKLS
jgi:molybdate transport system ATP-binding protein